MARAAAAPEETPVDVDAVTSPDPGLDYVVVWSRLSVHVDGAEEPLTLEQGTRLPAEAVSQGQHFVTLGAVIAVPRA